MWVVTVHQGSDSLVGISFVILMGVLHHSLDSSRNLVFSSEHLYLGITTLYYFTSPEPPEPLNPSVQVRCTCTPEPPRLFRLHQYCGVPWTIQPHPHCTHYSRIYSRILKQHYQDLRRGLRRCMGNEQTIVDVIV